MCGAFSAGFGLLILAVFTFTILSLTPCTFCLELSVLMVVLVVAAFVVCNNVSIASVLVV